MALVRQARPEPRRGRITGESHDEIVDLRRSHAQERKDVRSVVERKTVAGNHQLVQCKEDDLAFAVAELHE